MLVGILLFSVGAILAMEFKAQQIIEAIALIAMSAGALALIVAPIFGWVLLYQYQLRKKVPPIFFTLTRWGTVDMWSFVPFCVCVYYFYSGDMNVLPFVLLFSISAIFFYKFLKNRAIRSLETTGVPAKY